MVVGDRVSVRTRMQQLPAGQVPLSRQVGALSGWTTRFGHAHGARRLSPSLPSITSQPQA